MQRIDLQLLLDLRAALLGRDDAIANRRLSAVPEALPCIFLQGAQDVLGVARADGGVDWSFGRKRGLGL